MSYGSQPAFGQTPGISRTRSGRVNRTAAMLAVVAAVLGLLSLFSFGWYAGGDTRLPTSGTTFATIRTFTRYLDHELTATPSFGDNYSLGVAPVYFAWLAYVLTGLAVLLALLSSAPGALAVTRKVAAALVSLAGLGVTLWALQLVRYDGPGGSDRGTGYTDWFRHTSYGAWAMLAAFVLTLVASVLPSPS